SKRFHNTETNYPTSKAINQAIALIAQLGIDQAHHIVDFAHTAAAETDYKPQTFGGILQYTSRALADFEGSKRRAQDAVHTHEARQRVQQEEHLRSQYESYRTEQIARLRATMPPNELDAIVQAATTQFDREDTNPFGRDRMRQRAIEDALATHGQIPSFGEWKALQAGTAGV